VPVALCEKYGKPKAKRMKEKKYLADINTRYEGTEKLTTAYRKKT
jgi:hypothetical protein